MTCANCADKGLVKLNWSDAEPDFAVCLCETGLRMRVNRNEGHTCVPLWRVWCAREQVDPERVYLLEDVLTPAELAELGLAMTLPQDNREAALLAAGKVRAK